MKKMHTRNSLLRKVAAVSLALTLVAPMGMQAITGTALARSYGGHHRPVREYTILTDAGVNGSISPSGSVRVNSGSSQTFTFTPNSGYEVDTVCINGTTVSNNGKSYTFSNVTQNNTIQVTFKKLPTATMYTINASAGRGGSISPSGCISVYKNDRPTYTITADNGYVIKDVRVNGQSVGAVSSYTFRRVRENNEITATFEQKQSKPNVRITSVSAKSITKNSAQLSAKIKASGKYTIYWEYDAGAGFKTLKNSNKSSYKLTGLKAGTTYTARCTVKDNRGNSVVSSTVSFTTKGRSSGSSSGSSSQSQYPRDGVIKGGSVYVRKAADKYSSSLAVLYKDDTVTVCGFSESSNHAPGFYKIKWGNGYAYIAANYIDLK